jgi:23S rRNA pseudouridine1911/1915/1917 synthase
MPGARQLTAAGGETLLTFLVESGFNRTAAKNALKFGAVAINGTGVKQFDSPLTAGDRVTIGDLPTTAANTRLAAARIELLHEDEGLLVVEKPSGLLTVATDYDKTDTLFYRVMEYLRERDGRRAIRPHVVHRLDQETSGLVLLAKSRAVQERLQDHWTAVQKTYWAAVEGVPPEEGTISNYLTESKALLVYGNPNFSPGARKAVTHYRRLATRGGPSLLEIRLETGRKHQIRVHMADLGHPVAGDERYGAKTDPCSRLALHAGRLQLDHPLTHEPMSFHSPLPPVIAKLFPDWKPTG